MPSTVGSFVRMLVVALGALGLLVVGGLSVGIVVGAGLGTVVGAVVGISVVGDAVVRAIVSTVEGASVLIDVGGCVGAVE
jgi:hypothetical protein